ncbi:MAG: DNRLRE domain-containing protein, partial [Bacteroidota bacterium]
MVTYKKLLAAIYLLSIGVCTLTAQTMTVDLNPSKDNTIYEGSSWEANSSGMGPHVYSGSISLMRARRALLAFDVSGIPAGATITNVELTIRVSRANGASIPFNLFRMTSDWGEGTSAAGNIGGQGVSATSGDATWLCSFFGTSGCQTSWTNSGGDFVSSASSTVNLAGNGLYTFPSTAQLVADVQNWVDGNTDNFGWIMRSAETASRNARRINSRENATDPPSLSITFTTALPVELSEFTGSQRGDLHLLEWQTASEVDFSHFIVEQSIDQGRSFQPLSQISGRGQESTQATYAYSTFIPNANSVLYRLRMVDVDGSEDLSNIVELDGSSSLDEIAVWPNPVQDRLYFGTSLSAGAGQSLLQERIGSSAEIAVLSLQGQIVKRYSVSQNQSYVSISDISSG